MDAVWLPVLWHGDTLDNALSAMEQTKRAGILVEGDNRYEVVLMDHVRAAVRRGARTLAQVSERDPVHVPAVQDAMTFRVDLIHPLRTGLEYQTLLDGAGRSYALIAQAYDMGLIVTRHEGRRQMLSPANTYYCEGGADSPHTFPAPDVNVGDECLKCLRLPKGTIRLR